MLLKGLVAMAFVRGHAVPTEVHSCDTIAITIRADLQAESMLPKPDC